MTEQIETLTGPADASVQIKREGYVATVTLSNPTKRNALSHWVLEAITAACEVCERERMRVMILKTMLQHGTWSAGHDIGELPLDGTDPLAHGSALEAAIAALRHAPFPVIAQVQGSVWGGAVETVVSCDIVVADESARFAMTPANIGLPYNTAGLLHFTDRLGISAIKTMFFTAQPVEAEDALRLGLIDQLVPSERIEAQTRELAMHIAGKAPLAIAAVKEQLRVLSDMRALPASALGRISEIRRRAYQSPDFREGIEAFREKRPAVFSGAEG